MVQQITVTWSDIRIGQVLVNLQRFRLHPFPVFPVESLLRDLADIDLWIEVGGKSLMMVTCITIDNIQILDLVEVMLRRIGSIDTGHTRVKATTKDCRQTSLLEFLPISPLP